MKWFGSFLFVIVATTVLVVSVAAQTSLSIWPYYVEVMPEQRAAGLYDLVIPLPVMDKARPDLADLRLFDSANREIPYGIRIRREVNEIREIPARIFNAASTGPTASEVSVDLGENPGEHNVIEIETNGTEFRRLVMIEGSDSGREWRTLAYDAWLFRFVSQNHVAEVKRVTYGTSRYRYLRIRVSAEPLAERERPQITGVKVLMTVRESGSLSSWNVPVPSYQLMRNQGAHASAWTLDLGGRVPCDRLKLTIEEGSFSRPFQVESLDDPNNIRLIGSGVLSRHTGETDPLVIYFNQEENVQKLRLQITDYSNPTLTITGIEASAPARQLVFELKDKPGEPLRLFFGSANVPAPHYDFEKELATRLKKDVIGAGLGDVMPNREYVPEPKPLTERAPWFIYLVLAASSLALGFILFNLARTATRLNEPQS